MRDKEALNAMIPDIADAVLNIFAEKAGDLSDREAFGIVMTVLDTVTSILIHSFTGDDLEAAKNVVSSHAANAMGKIIRVQKDRDARAGDDEIVAIVIQEGTLQ